MSGARLQAELLKKYPSDRRAMDFGGMATIAAGVFLVLPLIVLAGLGVVFIMSLTTYHHPLLPKGSPGLAERGQLIRGTKPSAF